MDARRRIGVASLSIGLLLCGAFALAAHSRSTATRARAAATIQHTDMLAAQLTVAAFWREQDGIDAFLAFPRLHLSQELWRRELSFAKALGSTEPGDAVERSYVERARAANDALMSAFRKQGSLSGGVEDSLRRARHLRSAERSVLAPIAQLASSDRRQYLQGEAVAKSADRAGFRSEVASALIGFAAIVWFSLFAVRLVRRIENKNVELERADIAKDEFISTVSHELRTPLTSMNGYVELLLDKSGDPLTEEQRSFLATVQRGSARLEGLVNDLLLTAQLRAGRLEMRKTDADLVEIARQSVESAQAHAGHNTLTLSLTAPPHPIEIKADATRLAQALDNLISNAIKFTPEGGEVDVTLAQNDEQVTLTISDTGMGMTAAEIERLFEAFFRTDSAKQIQGTGLGLPIVKAIIDAHHGTINVTSQPNTGTSFVVSLPLAHPIVGRAVAAQAEQIVTA